MRALTLRVLALVVVVLAALACSDIDDPVPDTIRHMHGGSGARDAGDAS